MAKLVRLNNVENRKLVERLAKAEIIVYEDVQGHKIFVNWDGENINIKAKSISSEPINMIDVAMQKVYNKALNFFLNLDSRVKGLLKKNQWYGFEYFYDEQPAHIKYDRTPKNNLILTTIVKGKKNFTYDLDEIIEYANLFECDYLPVIFRGVLKQDQIDLISNFLNTSRNDLDYVFGEENFAYFFYKILNPRLENSFLMNDDNYQDNVEKLIIRFTDNNEEVSFEILNPMYTRLSTTNSTEHVEMYSLILLNFLEQCQLMNLDSIKLRGQSRDESYLDLICKLFNNYAEKIVEDLDDLDITIPEFFKNDKFKINVDLIDNRITKKHILASDKLEYIFKVILGSFSKKRKKPIGIFNEMTIVLFNNFVDKINAALDKHLKFLREVDINDDRLLNFADYFKVNYNTDAAGTVYPDIYTEIEAEEGESKKKKKGFPGKK
jgi:hypothetical protein